MGHSNLLTPAQAQTLQPALPPARHPMAWPCCACGPSACASRRVPTRPGRVLGTTFLGSIQRIQVRWHDLDLLVETSSAQPLQPGDAVALA